VRVLREDGFDPEWLESLALALGHCLLFDVFHQLAHPLSDLILAAI
jgi:hypothetical protein